MPRSPAQDETAAPTSLAAFFRREAGATDLPVRTLLLVSVVLHLTTWWFALEPYHLDEHFQILEFAWARAGLAPTEILPWEWHERIRPTLQPALALAVLTALRAVGLVDPLVWILLLRLGAIAMSLAVTLWVIDRVGPRLSVVGRRTLWLTSLFLWIVPYVHTRFSSEVLGGVTLVAALLLLERGASRRGDLLAGVLLGLSFLFRFQMGFAVAGLLAWVWWRRDRGWRAVLRAALPALGVVALGVLVDRWFYGAWVFTPWRYVELNLLEGRAADFGVEPWYFYITGSARWLVPPLGPVLVGVCLWALVARPRSPWVWAAAPFLVAHALVGHKELRFLWPLIWALPVACAWAADALPEGVLRSRTLRLVVGALALQNVLLLLMWSSPALHQGWWLDYDFYRAVQREAARGEGPTVLLYESGDPYGGNPLTFSLWIPPTVQRLPAETAPRVRDLDARFLVASRSEGTPQVPGFRVGELLHRGEAGYRTMARWVGLEHAPLVRLLGEIHQWREKGNPIRLYRLRPAGDVGLPARRTASTRASG